MVSSNELFIIKKYIRDYVKDPEYNFDILVTCYYIIEIYKNETLEILLNIARVALMLCFQYFETESNRQTNAKIRKLSYLCNSINITDVQRSILSFDILEHSPFLYLDERLNHFMILFNIEKIKHSLIKDKVCSSIEEYYFNHGYDNNTLEIVDCVILEKLAFLGYCINIELNISTPINLKFRSLETITPFDLEKIPFDKNLVFIGNKYVYRLCEKTTDYFPTNLVKEAIVMRKLGRDNRIIEMHGKYALVSERILGINLSSFMNLGKLNEQNIRIIYKSILEQVEELQKYKIIHDDIKPENMIINGDKVKLIDFEYSTSIFNHKRISKIKSGTPVYLSPEKIPIEFRPHLKSDIWSLGVIFVEMVRLSIKGVSEKEVDRGIYYETLFNEAKNCKELFRDISNIKREFIIQRLCSEDHKLIDFCCHMLEKSLKNRYTCEQLLKHEWLNFY